MIRAALYILLILGLLVLSIPGFAEAIGPVLPDFLEVLVIAIADFLDALWSYIKDLG